MFGIGYTELLVIAGICLLLFGNRIPSIMRSLGQGVTAFKQGVNTPIEDTTEEHA